MSFDTITLTCYGNAFLAGDPTPFPGGESDRVNVSFEFYATNPHDSGGSQINQLAATANEWFGYLKQSDVTGLRLAYVGNQNGQLIVKPVDQIGPGSELAILALRANGVPDVWLASVASWPKEFDGNPTASVAVQPVRRSIFRQLLEPLLIGGEDAPFDEPFYMKAFRLCLLVVLSPLLIAWNGYSLLLRLWQPISRSGGGPQIESAKSQRTIWRNIYRHSGSTTATSGDMENVAQTRKELIEVLYDMLDYVRDQPTAFEQNFHDALVELGQPVPEVSQQLRDYLQNTKQALRQSPASSESFGPPSVLTPTAGGVLNAWGHLRALQGAMGSWAEQDPGPANATAYSKYVSLTAKLYARMTAAMLAAVNSTCPRAKR